MIIWGLTYSVLLPNMSHACDSDVVFPSHKAIRYKDIPYFRYLSRLAHGQAQSRAVLFQLDEVEPHVEDCECDLNGHRGGRVPSQKCKDDVCAESHLSVETEIVPVDPNTQLDSAFLQLQ